MLSFHLSSTISGWSLPGNSAYHWHWGGKFARWNFTSPAAVQQCSRWYTSGKHAARYWAGTGSADCLGATLGTVWRKYSVADLGWTLPGEHKSRYAGSGTCGIRWRRHWNRTYWGRGHLFCHKHLHHWSRVCWRQGHVVGHRQWCCYYPSRVWQSQLHRSSGGGSDRRSERHKDFWTLCKSSEGLSWSSMQWRSRPANCWVFSRRIWSHRRCWDWEYSSGWSLCQLWWSVAAAVEWPLWWSVLGPLQKVCSCKKTGSSGILHQPQHNDKLDCWWGLSRQKLCRKICIWDNEVWQIWQDCW